MVQGFALIWLKKRTNENTPKPNANVYSVLMYGTRLCLNMAKKRTNQREQTKTKCKMFIE